MIDLKENFGKLNKKYPSYFFRNMKDIDMDINLFRKELGLIMPEELEFFIKHYILNLKHPDFGILTIEKIIDETKYLRSLNPKQNYIVITAHDDFFLCINLSQRNKDGTYPIFEVTDFLSEKYDSKNLINYIEKVIKLDIKIEKEIEKEDLKNEKTINKNRRK